MKRSLTTTATTKTELTNERVVRVCVIKPLNWLNAVQFPCSRRCLVEKGREYHAYPLVKPLAHNKVKSNGRTHITISSICVVVAFATFISNKLNNGLLGHDLTFLFIFLILCFITSIFIFFSCHLLDIFVVVVRKRSSNCFIKKKLLISLFATYSVLSPCVSVQ